MAPVMVTLLEYFDRTAGVFVYTQGSCYCMCSSEAPARPGEVCVQTRDCPTIEQQQC